jgi:hypothetical protein
MAFAFGTPSVSGNAASPLLGFASSRPGHVGQGEFSFTTFMLSCPLAGPFYFWLLGSCVRARELPFQFPFRL